MFSKVLETANFQLQANLANQSASNSSTVSPQDLQTPVNGSATDQTDLTPSQLSFAIQFAPFIYLGFGLVYTFYGSSKYHPLFISLLMGFWVSITVPFSNLITILCILLFAGSSLLWEGQNLMRQWTLWAGVGVYITRLLWVLLLSYFAPLWTQYILQGILLSFLYLFCGLSEGMGGGDRSKGHRYFALLGSCVFGANLIATSIGLFTQANIYWIALAQYLCMCVLGKIGHRVQKHFGIDSTCDDPMFKTVPPENHEQLLPIYSNISKISV